MISNHLKLTLGGFNIDISREDSVNVPEDSKPSQVIKNEAPKEEKVTKKPILKTFTLLEVSKHNKENDCWVVGKKKIHD